jgi:serpin B
VPELGLRVLDAVGGAPVLSPLGLHTALATIRSGASGCTREALDALLGPDPAPLDLDDESAVELLRAQAIWVDASARLADGFAAEAAARGVRADRLDFSDPRTPEVINAWANEKTRGIIPRVLEALEPLERLVLTDALFFDGAWTVPFDPDLTAPAPFRRADGSTRDVPTMHVIDGYLDHAEQDGLEAIRLPYGNSRRLRFWAVAGPPEEPPSAPRVDGPTWTRLRASLRPREGSLALPRLRVEAELDLRDPLRALGLAPAFEPSHDLDGVFTAGGDPTSLSRILQRARVDLDERGTRAAAVTTVSARAVSAPLDQPPPFDLRLDRPFVWGIEEEATGTLLFVGIVEDPGTA